MDQSLLNIKSFLKLTLIASWRMILCFSLWGITEKITCKAMFFVVQIFSRLNMQDDALC